MTASQFSNGGYVGHKLQVSGKSGYFSAWYAADGTLQAAEHVGCRAPVTLRSVRRGGPSWRALQGMHVIVHILATTPR